MRGQVRRVLAGRHAALSDDGRQRLAEEAMLRFVELAVAYTRALRTGNAAIASRMSDAAEQRELAGAHLDLRSLALTDAGLARRP